MTEKKIETTEMMDTKKLLDGIAQNSIYAKGVAAASLIYCCKLFQGEMVPGNVLELGPAEGLMTRLFYKDANTFQKWAGGGVNCIQPWKEAVFLRKHCKKSIPKWMSMRA